MDLGAQNQAPLMKNAAQFSVSAHGACGRCTMRRRAVGPLLPTLVRLLLLQLVCGSGGGGGGSSAPAAPRTLCVCGPENDLYRLLQPPPQRYASVASALAARPGRGDALLVLADGYPTMPTAISPAQYAAIAAAGARVFVEFPAALPARSALNLSGSTPQPLDEACGISAGAGHNGGAGLGSSSISRVVIATNATRGHGLAPMRILGIHGSVVMPTTLGARQSCLPWPAGKRRAMNASVRVVLPTHLSALCARPTEQPPSHVEYAGVVCGADGAILWQNFSVKDVRSGLKTTQCSFTCAASPEFCGPECGGASPKVPTLPSHLCPAASNNGSGAGEAAPVIAVAARVAGYDTALFGLPADGIAAILFEATDSALVATTSFSNVLQGRYGPTEAWDSLLAFILSWVGSTLTLSPLMPLVRPTYTRNETLSLVAAERKALAGAVTHLCDMSGLLYSSLSGTQAADLDRQCPVSTAPPAGSATACINEGFSSVIDWRGNQPERNNTVSRRTDGDAYAALGIAMAGVVEQNQTRIEIGAAMIEYIFFWSGCQQRLEAGSSGAEAADASKGLVAWFPVPNDGAALYYAQVDAAVFISGVALAGLLPRERQERWAEPLLHQAFGNLRTTGLQGFRPSSTNQRTMRARGWRSYFNSSMAANCGRDCTVGMQSWMWYTYLWAGHHTGISLFGERVYEATRQEMALWYQGRWQCITTMSQQLVRHVQLVLCIIATSAFPVASVFD
jgi:hypothetical protein